MSADPATQHRLKSLVTRIAQKGGVRSGNEPWMWTHNGVFASLCVWIGWAEVVNSQYFKEVTPWR